MSDNVAVLEGFTKEVHLGNLFLLVKQNTDLKGTFKAWNMDKQEFVYVNGWLF
jgi:hypothetical protein